MADYASRDRGHVTGFASAEGDPAHRTRIADVLDRHGFAALPAHSDGDRDDGYEEALTYWRDDGTARTVVVDSGIVPAFRPLLGELFGVLGVTDDVA